MCVVFVVCYVVERRGSGRGRGGTVYRIPLPTGKSMIKVDLHIPVLVICVLTF